MGSRGYPNLLLVVVDATYPNDELDDWCIAFHPSRNEYQFVKDKREEGVQALYLLLVPRLILTSIMIIEQVGHLVVRESGIGPP